MKALLLFMVCLISAPSYSATSKFDMSVACSEFENLNNYEQGQCIGRQHEEIDEEMAKTYRHLMSKVDKQAKIKLRDAQRAWIKFRDTNCDFEGTGTLGGSAHSWVVTSCKSRVTVKRTEELRAWLLCEQDEGNLSCPRFK